MLLSKCLWIVCVSGMEIILFIVNKRNQHYITIVCSIVFINYCQLFYFSCHFQVVMNTIIFILKWMQLIGGSIIIAVSPLGHFRVSLNLVVKARLSAKLFIWILVLFAFEWKLIFLIKNFTLSLSLIMSNLAYYYWCFSSNNSKFCTSSAISITNFVCSCHWLVWNPDIQALAKFLFTLHVSLDSNEDKFSCEQSTETISTA